MSRDVHIDANSHAGLMDRMYRNQRHIYDLTRKYYLLGRDHTVQKLNIPFGGSLLEVGCGTGRNLLLAHRHYPSAKLYGFDISEQMLISARRAFRGLKQIPDFCAADATSFSAGDFGLQGFDRIMISYTLSMIPNWTAAVDSAIDALAPGGELHIVDFGQQGRLPGWFRRLLTFWLARFHVSPRADLRAVLSTRARVCGAQLTFEEIAGGYAWRAVITTVS